MSRFKIREESLEDILSEIFLENTQTGEFVSVIPGFGATINQLRLSKNGKLHDLIDGNKNYSDLMSNGIGAFKGMILFPFPNRIANGTYTFEGNDYQHLINEVDRNNALHGFLYMKKFHFIDSGVSDSEAFITISYEVEDQDQNYPFDFEVIVKIYFSVNGMKCQTTMINKGNKTMPVGLGWHQYFKTGSKVNDLQLFNPAKSELIVDTQMIPTGAMIDNPFYKQQLINDTFIDTGYVIDEIEGIAETCVTDKINNIILTVWQETGKDKFNYLQIYTPASRDCIAIEPMTCAANAFNNGLGTISLNPGKQKSVSYGVYLK